MRKSKQETAETRARIVESAAASFMKNGIASTGLSDLMADAGLTQGGFYRHFESKDHLVAEASAKALTDVTNRLANLAVGKSEAKGLEAIVRKYLSLSHRDDPETGCPLGALGSELARCDLSIRGAASEGFLAMVDIVAAQITDVRPAEARKRALIAVSTMIGALTMARITTDEALSKQLLTIAAASILEKAKGDS